MAASASSKGAMGNRSIKVLCCDRHLHGSVACFVKSPLAKQLKWAGVLYSQKATTHSAGPVGYSIGIASLLVIQFRGTVLATKQKEALRYCTSLITGTLIY